MEKQSVDDFLTDWYETVRAQPGSNELYLRLKPAIQSLLPDDVES